MTGLLGHVVILLSITEYVKGGLQIFFLMSPFAAVTPNRSPGQKLITLALDERLLDSLDQARGNVSRSLFIREAIAKRLLEELHLKEDILEVTAAPDRKGKGGPQTRYLTKRQAKKKQ